MDSALFLDRIKRTVHGFDKAAQVILFGSRARGDAKDVSDWDFLILLNGRVNEEIKANIRNKLLETEIENEQVISTIIYSKENWQNLSITPLFKNIDKEGILV